MFNVQQWPQLLEAGALDGLSTATIVSLQPGVGDVPLVTTLRDGSEALIAKRLLLPYLQRAVDHVIRAGADVVCVLCTGSFPALQATIRLVFPDRLLVHTVDALLPVGTLGVLMPHEGQREVMMEKWTTLDRAAVARAASPYGASGLLSVQAESLVKDGAEIIVMDCMGFDRSMQQTIRDTVAVPVLLANSVIGVLLNELIGMSQPSQVPSAV